MRSKLVFLLLLVIASGCEKNKNKEPAAGGADHRKKVMPPTKDHLADYLSDLPGSGKQLLAKIETPLGVINCELFPDRAPMTVANFIGLATGKKAWKNPTTGAIEVGKPYYDGLVFHRVLPGFMIQGGDPTGTGTSGPGYNFADETEPTDQIVPGLLAMANTGRPVTNGSQFFVMEGAAKWLNGKHTIFGKCKEIEVVTKITGVKVTNPEAGSPEQPVTMKVTITRG